MSGRSDGRLMVEVPGALRRSLPPEAQRVYRAAFREARGAGADEDTARVAAQGAVEESFRRSADGWQPRLPPAGSGGPYGEAAIALLARRASFPCTNGQLVAQAGDPQVEIAEGEPMPLREVLELLDGGYWVDSAQLLAAVHAAWPKVRQRSDARHRAPAAEKPLSHPGL